MEGAGTAKRVKCAALSAFRSAGLFRAARNSSWRRRRLAILCYHGLALEDEHLWAPAMFLDAPRFESRLKLLRDGGYSVLPLGEALDRLARGTLPPLSVALTFDDGTSDFHRLAMPLLARYGMPATLYLTTYFCRRPQPVTPIFYDYLLWKGRAAHRPGASLPGLGSGTDPSDPDSRARAAALLGGRIRSENWTAADQQDYSRRLAAALSVDYDALAAARILHLMNPAEAAEAAAAGIDIQLHTHRHRTPLDRALFLREIEDNRREIGALCGGEERTHFCYPSGVHDPRFLPWLREAGVRSATTCESGLAASSTDPLLLPRVVDTCRLTALEFESWLSGVGHWVRSRRRAGAPAADPVHKV